MGRRGNVKKASGRYPPREAFATRPSPEVVAEGGEVGAITALDRPRFVEAVDLGVPHTGERPCDSVPAASDSSEVTPRAAATAQRAEPSVRRRGGFPWLVLLAVGVFTSIAGVLVGYWLALGAL